MLQGIHLTLMIGPVIPLPVGSDVLDALTSVQVVNSTDAASTFQLTFTLKTRSPLYTTFILSSGTPIPLVRVLLIATIQGQPEVLIDGVMTDHQLSPAANGHSTLTVTGEDLSRVMDFIDFSGIPYPAMPRELRVALVVAKYAVLGLIPVVIPSILIDIPLPIGKIPAHQGRDLQYVKKLAAEVGYAFYVEPGPSPGQSIAYWGPELRIGVPQKALNYDMDAHTNVESMSFSYDPHHKMMPIVVVLDEIAKTPIPIPIPDITPLSPPLGAIPPFPTKFKFITGAAKYGYPQAIMTGLAAAAKTADAVKGTGTLDVVRYGGILKARRLVGVRGMGEAYDGLYYVKSVTHQIKRGEYKQSFTLVRNGLISTLSSIPV